MLLVSFAFLWETGKSPAKQDFYTKNPRYISGRAKYQIINQQLFALGVQFFLEVCALEPDESLHGEYTFAPYTTNAMDHMIVSFVPLEFFGAWEVPKFGLRSNGVGREGVKQS